MKTEAEIRSKIEDYNGAIEDEKTKMANLKNAYGKAESLNEKVSFSVDAKDCEAKIDRYGALIDELEWVLE